MRVGQDVWAAQPEGYSIPGWIMQIVGNRITVKHGEEDGDPWQHTYDRRDIRPDDRA